MSNNFYSGQAVLLVCTVDAEGSGPLIELLLSADADHAVEAIENVSSAAIRSCWPLDKAEAIGRDILSQVAAARAETDMYADIDEDGPDDGTTPLGPHRPVEQESGPR